MVVLKEIFTGIASSIEEVYYSNLPNTPALNYEHVLI